MKLVSSDCVVNAPMPTQAASSTGFGRRSTSRSGGLSTGSRLACANSGLSTTFRRTNRPTASSTMLSRNGTRQPQERNASSGRVATSVTTPADSTEPSGAPSCVKLDHRPRRDPCACSACSTTISIAPPHSPPIAMPCTTRRATSRTGAQTPIASYVGSSPMRKLPQPIRTMVSSIIDLRPIRSPKCPNTMPPSGRAR